MTKKQLDHVFYSRIKELEIHCTKTVQNFEQLSREDLYQEFEYLAEQLMSIGMTREGGSYEK